MIKNCQFCYVKDCKLIFERTEFNMFLNVDFNKNKLIVDVHTPLASRIKKEIKISYCPFCGKKV